MGREGREHRAVVTGIGLVTALGSSCETFWAAAMAGSCGIRPVRGLDTSGYGSPLGAEVIDFDPARVRHLAPEPSDRTIDFALAAANEALRAARLSLETLDRDRVGVVLGTCQGGARSWEAWQRQWILKGLTEADPRLLWFYPFVAPADAISAAFGLRGPKSTISTACAAGANAVGYALDLIRLGRADVVLAGGAEPLAALGYAGFTSLQSLFPEPCRPYSATRTGLTLGEGAGILVLERQDLAERRGAPVLAEVLGYGLSADGYHPTAPDPGGLGAARAIRDALADAGVRPDEVGYINGHGTGTVKNDEAETKGIKAAFGEHACRIPVSSTKSMIGHTLGAAGAVEGITTVLALAHQVLPPTVNHQGGDKDCDLDYVPNVARPAALSVALSNSFAFGGNNAAVVYARPGRAARDGWPRPVPGARVVVTGAAALTAAGIGVQALWDALVAGRSCLRPIAGFDASSYPCRTGGEVHGFDPTVFISPKDLRRIDSMSRYALAVSKLALADAGLAITPETGERIGVICGSAAGPVESLQCFNKPVIEGGPDSANPAHFPNTVYNAAAGLVAMHLKATGPSSTLTVDGASSSNAIGYAADLLRRGAADAVICASMDELNEPILAAYTNLGLLSPDPPRPYDASRRGMQLAAAGAGLILETLDHARARGARIYAEVAGIGMSADACGVGRIDPRGRGLARAMRLALDEAGLVPETLGGIIGYANGSPAFDLAEGQAIRRALGPAAERVPVTSLKGTLGDPQGCAGALGVIAAVGALREGRIPPTLGVERVDPRCPVRVVCERALDVSPGPILVNAMAVGGTNIALCLTPCAG